MAFVFCCTEKTGLAGAGGHSPPILRGRRRERRLFSVVSKQAEPAHQRFLWFLSPRGHLAISGHIFGCYNWGREGAAGIMGRCTRGEAKHPSTHTFVSQQRIQPQVVTVSRLRNPDLNSSWKVLIDLSFCWCQAPWWTLLVIEFFAAYLASVCQWWCRALLSHPCSFRWSHTRLFSLVTARQVAAQPELWDA